MFNKSPRLHFLYLFIALNCIAAYLMYLDRELIGDAKGSVHSISNLIFSMLLVIASYYIVLSPLFNLMYKFKVDSFQFRPYSYLAGARIGKFLILIQIAYIIFNYVFGLNTAGAANKVTTSLSIIWILLPPDALFIIYYGVYRENKYFYPNLAIYLISNFLRGWSGIFFITIIFEWCRAVRMQKLNPKIVIILLITVLLLYPFILNLKFAIRASASLNITLDQLIQNFLQQINANEYSLLFGNALQQLVGRLQVTSILVEVIRLQDVLQEKFANGDFAPFWLEGLHGIFYYKIILGRFPVWLGSYFTQYIGSPLNLGDWNVNVSLAAWFFVAPYLSIIYITYILFICFISYYLTRKIHGDNIESEKDMLWITWLLYILPPWFSVMVAFIFALGIFLLLKIIMSSFPSLKLSFN